jgi:magnesium chelatase subunit D
MSSYVFPFVAFLGQERMKLALLLNAIDPQIGGVLIRGEKGTGKSTAARALSALLPRVESHAGCQWACDPTRPEEWCDHCLSLQHRTRTERCTPFETLPLNATEEMVLGGLDFSRTVRNGTRTLQPGLLARVHRGVLYIDEVNLLDDHLVDIILDAAASGENVLEREGISFRHACRFTLVGTMNPEEGSLRPQLLDRFGLCVEVKAEPDPALRVQLIERREEYERGPREFCEKYSTESTAYRARIASARSLLPEIRIPAPVRDYIADLTLSQNVAGHRADLVIARAACAYAAWHGRTTARVQDVVQVAELALLHRRRDSLPPPPPPPPAPAEDNSSDAPPQQPPPQQQQGNTSAATTRTQPAMRNHQTSHSTLERPSKSGRLRLPKIASYGAVPAGVHGPAPAKSRGVTCEVAFPRRAAIWRSMLLSALRHRIRRAGAAVRIRQSSSGSKTGAKRCARSALERSSCLSSIRAVRWAHADAWSRRRAPSCRYSSMPTRNVIV